MTADQRVVLTTGANSSLGVATAVAVARRGFRSVGTVRTPAKAGQVEAAARAAGVEVETALLDITEPVACADTIARYQPYGLVNCAGSLAVAAIEDAQDDDAWLALETLAVAPMRLARLALPAMREGGGGRIVQVSSSAGRITFPLLGWYQAAKHALEAASDALRMEVAADGIAVVLIEPGGFPSDMSHSLLASDIPENSRYDAAYRSWQSNLRFVRPLWTTPERVAALIADILISRRPRSRYVVGTDALLSITTAPFTPTAFRDAAVRRLTGL
jgi:NAD(P)-dependent dehydrogenase (short-subunit alcohol dehydrogenase family)